MRALVTHADGVTTSTTNAIAYVTVSEPGGLALLLAALAGLIRYARRWKQR